MSSSSSSEIKLDSIIPGYTEHKYYSETLTSVKSKLRKLVETNQKACASISKLQDHRKNNTHPRGLKLSFTFEDKDLKLDYELRREQFVKFIINSLLEDNKRKSEKALEEMDDLVKEAAKLIQILASKHLKLESKQSDPIYTDVTKLLQDYIQEQTAIYELGGKLLKMGL